LKLNDVFGGKHGEMFNDGMLDIPQEDVPKVKFHPIKLILNIPIFLFNFLLHSQKRSEAYISRMCFSNDQLDVLDLNEMSQDSLAINAISAIEQCSEFTDTIGILKGIDCFLILSLISNRWLKDDTLANKLLAGVGNMEDAQAGLDMWQIAVKAHASPEVKKIINTGDHWRKIEKKLDECQDGQAFLKRWGDFMARHGHHCRGEIELYNPRWFEMPDYILNVVRSYIKNVEQNNPVENQSLQTLKREQLLQKCCKKLKNPFKRVLFKYFLRHAQQGGVFRENWKNQIARRVALVRKILLHLGQILQKKGVLGNPDYIFFLRLEEIEPVTHNKADFDIKKTIASRRAEYEKNKSVMPPKVVIGKFNPDDYTPDAVDTNAEVLNGLAVSSGVVTGKARVILKADTDEQVLPGEILVAPFTDPGWTPYFMTAAAIVMDIGGLLSHGSIIAREYGIPAVVNVGPATKIIKTGQTIQVDANRGIVKIIR
jgi:pyruvate,water dikinase